MYACMYVCILCMYVCMYVPYNVNFDGGKFQRIGDQEKINE